MVYIYKIWVGGALVKQDLSGLWNVDVQSGMVAWTWTKGLSSYHVSDRKEFVIIHSSSRKQEVGKCHCTIMNTKRILFISVFQVAFKLCASLTSCMCSCWKWSPISRSFRPICTSTLVLSSSRSSRFSSSCCSSSPDSSDTDGTWAVKPESPPGKKIKSVHG